MTGAVLGYGAKVLMGDGATPEVFAELGEVGDHEIGETVGTIDVTNHQSPGARREYIFDLIDGDEISIPVNYLPTNATHDRSTGVRSKLRTRVNFRFLSPGETEYFQVECLVIGITRAMPVGGVMQMTITLKQSGAVTYPAVA